MQRATGNTKMFWETAGSIATLQPCSMPTCFCLLCCCHACSVPTILLAHNFRSQPQSWLVWLAAHRLSPASFCAYRVPLPTWGLIVLLTPATLLLLAVLILPILERNHTMIFATSAAVVIGFILYPLFTMAKEKKWMSFSNLQFDFAHDTAGNARTYTIHASGHLNYDASYNVEYVDVCHDGDTGVRTTGSSMDLGSDHRWGIGSSGRGPGSVADSLGGFAVGQSPRSPFVGRYAHHHSRAVSAPAAVAMAVAAAAPAGPDSSATAAGRSRLSYAIVHTAAADGAAGTHSAGAAGATLTVVGSAASAPLTSGNLSDVAESGELVDEEMPLLDSAAKTAAGMAASERANEV
eukprot:GHRR01009299.1.p1 GENE.GHRR01009299.1~~GHRR01009299.1.p1  ORF type:complete len:350 (+),score=104.24 GHRR01009299.1:1950-2999(+)